MAYENEDNFVILERKEFKEYEVLLIVHSDGLYGIRMLKDGHERYYDTFYSLREGLDYFDSIDSKRIVHGYFSAQNKHYSKAELEKIIKEEYSRDILNPTLFSFTNNAFFTPDTRTCTNKIYSTRSDVIYITYSDMKEDLF